MKMFIVATNTSSTALVKASNEEEAKALAIRFFIDELDIDYTDEIEVYDALEYFEDNEVKDIDFN